MLEFCSSSEAVSLEVAHGKLKNCDTRKLVTLCIALILINVIYEDVFSFPFHLSFELGAIALP